MREIEQDGFITDEIYIQETKPLERVDMDRAIPAKGCKYPKCEECRDYRNGYCTVPIVVTKQMWLMSDDREREFRREISDLKEMVADTVLGSKSSAETGNYSVDDDFQFLTDEEYEALPPLNKYWYDQAVATLLREGLEKSVGSVITDNTTNSVKIQKFAPLSKEEDEP